MISNDKLYIGYFLNNFKHGLGVCIHNKNKTKIFGNWENDLLNGYVIYISTNKEQIWFMKNNKIKRKITHDEEIQKLKKTDDIINLTKAFTFIDM